MEQILCVAEKDRDREREREKKIQGERDSRGLCMRIQEAALEERKPQGKPRTAFKAIVRRLDLIQMGPRDLAEVY